MLVYIKKPHPRITYYDLHLSHLIGESWCGVTPVWHSSEMANRGGHLNDFKFLSVVLLTVARKAEAFRCCSGVE